MRKAVKIIGVGDLSQLCQSGKFSGTYMIVNKKKMKLVAILKTMPKPKKAIVYKYLLTEYD